MPARNFWKFSGIDSEFLRTTVDIFINRTLVDWVCRVGSELLARDVSNGTAIRAIRRAVLEGRLDPVSPDTYITLKAVDENERLLVNSCSGGDPAATTLIERHKRKVHAHDFEIR